MDYQAVRDKMASEVRGAMFAQKITQLDLATTAFVSKQVISHLRNAKGNPNIMNIYAVYKALGITSIDL